MTRCFSALLLCFALACGDEDVPPAGSADTGPALDATAPGSDGGPSDDVGAVDAGNVIDAGGDDVGPSEDVGPELEDAATAGMCPPAGPFGTTVGEIAPDAMLEDCDGNPVSLHSMCGESAVWLYRFSEWCPPCQRFVRGDAENFYQRFVDDGVQAVVVIAQNAGGEIATRSDCARLSEQFGLSFPVLIDPRNEMNGLGIQVNAEAMAFDSDMRILYSAQYNHGGIPAAVMSVLE
ncbi:MAG: peroxiredoxin [Polyangiales bacterium]|jgi:peroxiredoxin